MCSPVRREEVVPVDFDVALPLDLVLDGGQGGADRSLNHGLVGLAAADSHLRGKSGIFLLQITGNLFVFIKTNMANLCFYSYLGNSKCVSVW